MSVQLFRAPQPLILQLKLDLGRPYLFRAIYSAAPLDWADLIFEGVAILCPQICEQRRSNKGRDVHNQVSPARGQDLADWSAVRIIFMRNLPSTSRSWNVLSQMSWKRMSSSDTPLGEKLTNLPSQPDAFSGLLSHNGDIQI